VCSIERKCLSVYLPWSSPRRALIPALLRANALRPAPQGFRPLSTTVSSLPAGPTGVADHTAKPLGRAHARPKERAVAGARVPGTATVLGSGPLKDTGLACDPQEQGRREQKPGRPLPCRVSGELGKGPGG